MTTKIILDKSALEYLFTDTELATSFNDGVLQTLFNKKVDNFLKQQQITEFDNQMLSFMKRSEWAEIFTGSVTKYTEMAKTEIKDMLTAKDNQQLIKFMVTQHIEKAIAEQKLDIMLKEIIFNFVKDNIKSILSTNKQLISELIAEEVKEFIKQKMEN